MFAGYLNYLSFRINEGYPGASTGLVGQSYLACSIGTVSAFMAGWLANVLVCLSSMRWLPQSSIITRVRWVVLSTSFMSHLSTLVGIWRLADGIYLRAIWLDSILNVSYAIGGLGTCCMWLYGQMHQTRRR